MQRNSLITYDDVMKASTVFQLLQFGFATINYLLMLKGAMVLAYLSLLFNIIMFFLANSALIFDLWNIRENQKHTKYKWFDILYSTTIHVVLMSLVPAYMWIGSMIIGMFFITKIHSMIKYR